MMDATLCCGRLLFVVVDDLEARDNVFTEAEVFNKSC